MNKLRELGLLFLLVLVSFFSCKNANNAKTCEREKLNIATRTDDETMQALVGIWQTVSDFEEDKGYRVYPIHPESAPELDSYVLYAFSSDGKSCLATKSINPKTGKTYLMRQEIFDATYTVKGNVISMQNKNGVEEPKFILRDNYLTTFTKSYVNKLQVRTLKKVESPTIEEIRNAPTE